MWYVVYMSVSILLHPMPEIIPVPFPSFLACEDHAMFVEQVMSLDQRTTVRAGCVKLPGTPL